MLFCRVTMMQIQMSLVQMEEKDPIPYFRGTQDQFIQLLLVLWEILYFPLQPIQQYSPVGHYFASASHDRTARIWSMERIQPLRIMAGHLSDVDCVQWHAYLISLVLKHLSISFQHFMFKV
ncbi:uncharacterized protein LOC133826447 [Humulus lupulus]|uniref:uncharacterized protein LOC133826447 n=1 Tax=Humulus lupulus TaxID=3486 RepID=UPI002B416975|nr:uncharacterized protein LOC133826447 [Humulus lupulus]